MNRFVEQVAVVTGAGRGIGKAIALRLASEGASIAVVSRTESNSQSTAGEINALRPESARAYAVDVVEMPESPATGSACGCRKKIGTLSWTPILKGRFILSKAWNVR